MFTTSSLISGVSGADAVKKKILLLKGKEREISHVNLFHTAQSHLLGSRFVLHMFIFNGGWRGFICMLQYGSAKMLGDGS